MQAGIHFFRFPAHARGVPGNLDRQTGDKIADLLFSLNREHGTTLILVTHDPLLAARCDRRLRLVDGQLREEA
ncbi:hypothetical protein CQA86_19385 [Klebsiella pneumoniae]|nr:hypothetical protein CQA86_19385 [Klebsiella pneumoniae]